MATNRRLNVLICAYACNPRHGSEGGVGWGWVEAISRYHSLHVLVGAHNRGDIQAELKARPELSKNLNFHYIPRRRWRTLERIWPPAYLLSYKHQWQNAAFECAKQLHNESKFDLVHQLTYVGFRVPGLLWKLEPPFVWGPVGGLEQTTWSLLPSLGLRGVLHFAARNLLNDWDRRFARLPRRAFNASSGLIAATTGIQKEIKRFYSLDSQVISEVGLPPIQACTPTQRKPGEPLHILWSGLHIPRKALTFLLDALQCMPQHIDWNLKVLGDGRCRRSWQKHAESGQIADRCNWAGEVPRADALKELKKAHLLVVTSVYDLTSTVVVEALASGVPVVCPNHCGFGDAVDSSCGILFDASKPRTIRDGLIKALIAMNDETLRFALAWGAIKKSRAYAWDEKAKAVHKIYAKAVCAAAGTNPSPWEMPDPL